jgi:Protein of unknown function (DUF1572)
LIDMQALDQQALGESFIAEAIAAFRNYKNLADRAIAQTSDANLRQALDENTNSIAVIMKHMAGNMISRWTDFLTTDGEKPDRHRDEEFIDRFKSRQEVVEYWERGWRVLFETLQSLKVENVLKTITIRGEGMSAIAAIDRQMLHYGYHVGQIVMIARIHAKNQWTMLTIPRGASDEYNREMGHR